MSSDRDQRHSTSTRLRDDPRRPARMPSREAFAAARRRDVLRGDGRLFIVAADHPARGALAVGGDADAPWRTATTCSTGSRVALSRPGVDGVLGTPDIIDDLAALGLLDDKLIVGSMNRGGLRGRIVRDGRPLSPATTSPRWSTAGIDFAKTLLRVNLADAGTASDPRGDRARRHRRPRPPACRSCSSRS